MNLTKLMNGIGMLLGILLVSPLIIGELVLLFISWLIVVSYPILITIVILKLLGFL